MKPYRVARSETCAPPAVTFTERLTFSAFNCSRIDCAAFQNSCLRRKFRLRLRENLCAFLVILRRRNFVGLIAAEQIVELLLLGTGDICARPLHCLESLRGLHGFLLFLFRS